MSRKVCADRKKKRGTLASSSFRWMLEGLRFGGGGELGGVGCPFDVFGLGEGDGDEADEDAGGGGDLGVGQGVVEVDFGVDPDELHEEAADAAEHKVDAGEPADGAGALAELPENPERRPREKSSSYMGVGWTSASGGVGGTRAFLAMWTPQGRVVLMP